LFGLEKRNFNEEEVLKYFIYLQVIFHTLLLYTSGQRFKLPNLRAQWHLMELQEFEFGTSLGHFVIQLYYSELKSLSTHTRI